MADERIGIDIGGTFTDGVILDSATGNVRLVKLPSTPGDPSVAFMNVTSRILDESGCSPEDISGIAHGTTVATNAIIEGKGAKTALIATEGFRDVFEIARQIRPKLYDIFCEKPPPLVPRQLCFEVPERLNYAGEVLTDLDEECVRSVAAQMKKEEVQSVVICLLHSYVNPSHERRVAEIVLDEMPGLSLTLSSDICPEMREYFRASTAAINAILMPVVAGYVERLDGRLKESGIRQALHLMTSSGGIISSKLAQTEPVHLIESGPAAGVLASAWLGEILKERNVISFDMGGTTAKAGLIESGEPKVAPHFEVGSAAVAESKSAGYPVRTPVVDLVEIGAGGGSIGWVDPGGGLKVGPQSGGADPGPACYGLGNTEPCVTDANLALGRISAGSFLGGEQKLEPEKAEAALSKLAGQLDMSATDAANGIIEIANANMVGAIRLISVQRGFDPREFVLVAFGGAGPMHANAIARELNISKVIIPMSPGVFSALGLLVTDIRHDYVRSFLREMEGVDFGELNRLFGEMANEARGVLADEEVLEQDMTFSKSLDLRCIGQAYELTIQAPLHALTEADAAAIHRDFFKEHERAYGYAESSEPIEIVNLRLRASGEIPKPRPRAIERRQSGEPPVQDTREVFFTETGGQALSNVYNRYELKSGDRITGPAIVEELDSTTVIHPGWSASADEFGNLFIEKE